MFSQENFRRLIWRKQSAAIRVAERTVKMLRAFIRLRGNKQPFISERLHFTFPKNSSAFYQSPFFGRLYQCRASCKTECCPKTNCSAKVLRADFFKKNIALFVPNFFREFRRRQMLIKRKPKRFVAHLYISYFDVIHFAPDFIIFLPTRRVLRQIF